MKYSSKTAHNALKGRINRLEGQQFEQIIEVSCDYYRLKGLAFIEKTPEPFRVTSRAEKGQFRGHFMRQAQPDFKGTLKGGRAIVFDAKSTTTDKIPISALTPEQVSCLDTHADLGAVAGVFLCYSFRRFFFLPFGMFMHAKELNGHKHWTVKDCEKYPAKEVARIPALSIQPWNYELLRFLTTINEKLE